VDTHSVQSAEQPAAAPGFAPARSVVLVGLMGAGKTKIGRRLAVRLNMPFYDSDIEIEAAAGETTLEIYTLEKKDPNAGPALDNVRVVAVPGKKGR